MPRQSRSRRSRAAGEIWKLIGAGVLALLTLIAAVWGTILWATTPSPPQRDKITLCPSIPPHDIIVVVIDTTDGLPEQAKVDATKRLTDFIEASPEGALLDLRVIDPTKKAGRTILTLCNPGDGRGVSELIGNPEMAKKVWRQRFREPLIRALEGSFQSVCSKTSPLLMTFQGIALERFAGAEAARARKQLIVVSDMIENVPGEYTQYPPADLHYERFKSLPAYRKVRTDLTGAEVRILRIQRILSRPIE